MDSKEAFLTKTPESIIMRKFLPVMICTYNQISGFGKATGNVTLDDPIEKKIYKRRLRRNF